MVAARLSETGAKVILLEAGPRDTSPWIHIPAGMLKLLFDRHTHKLLGVHILGQRATEIVHIGQAVMAYGGTIEYFRDTVFNYPTLAEAYKVAALDGLNKL